MKKFIIKVFRNSPASSGVMLLFITLHLFGVRDLWEPMTVDIILIFFLYLLVMVTYVFFILPKTEKHNREKITWTVVGSSVVVLTILAKIFI